MRPRPAKSGMDLVGLSQLDRLESTLPVLVALGRTSPAPARSVVAPLRVNLCLQIMPGKGS